MEEIKIPVYSYDELSGMAKQRAYLKALDSYFYSVSLAIRERLADIVEADDVFVGERGAKSVCATVWWNKSKSKLLVCANTPFSKRTISVDATSIPDDTPIGRIVDVVVGTIRELCTPELINGGLSVGGAIFLADGTLAANLLEELEALA